MSERAGEGGGQKLTLPLSSQTYHKACLKCTTCNKRLDSHLLVEHDELVSPRDRENVEDARGGGGGELG